MKGPLQGGRLKVGRRMQSCHHGPAAHGSSVLDPYPNTATVVGVEHARPVVGPERLRPTKSDENGVGCSTCFLALTPGFLPCPTPSQTRSKIKASFYRKMENPPNARVLRLNPAPSPLPLTSHNRMRHSHPIQP